MASLCQICGDTGFEELLEYCMKCRTFAQHRYCLPKLPKPDKKVIWTCESCESRSVNEDSLEKLAVDGGGSKDVSFLQLQNHVASCSQRELFEDESSPYIYPEQDKGRKMKRRRIILADEGQLDHAVQPDCADQDVANKVMKLPSESVMALSPPCTDSGEVTIGSCIAALKPSATQATVQDVHDDQHLQQSARPIYGYIWRGCISFGDEKYGPLTAHLSTLACQRVCNAAKLLPPVLHMEKLSRLDSLPSNFKNSPPGDDKIGLFFLPKSTMVEPLVDQLLADVIQKDLVFKCMLDEVELLMFPSTILPKENHRFQEKYYLWGAFRRRQIPAISSIADCRIAPSDAEEENQRMEVSVMNTGDEGEGLGCGEPSPDGSHSSNFPLSPYSVLQHPKSNELTEEIQKSVDLFKLAEGKRVVEARGGESQEREEGEIWDTHEKGEERDMDERKVYKVFNEGDFLPSFPSAVENTSIASKVGDRRNKETKSHNEKPQELEDGEFLMENEEQRDRDNERRVDEGFNEGDFLLSFPPAVENTSIASKVGGRRNKEIESHNEKPQELEEGEILEENEEQEEIQCANGPEEGECLPLFPLFGEYLGIASGIKNCNELNLEFGL